MTPDTHDLSPTMHEPSPTTTPMHGPSATTMHDPSATTMHDPSIVVFVRVPADVSGLRPGSHLVRVLELPEALRVYGRSWVAERLALLREDVLAGA